MPGKLQKEIHQRKPFGTVEEEAFLNVIRTAEVLRRAEEALLAPHGLTLTQYNALRILRGAGEEGATCSGISERLVTRDPDVTRLVDRLEKAGLVARERSTTDRRVVLVRISAAGLALLESLTAPLKTRMRELFHGIGRERLSELIGVLEEIRAKETKP